MSVLIPPSIVMYKFIIDFAVADRIAEARSRAMRVGLPQT